MFIRKYLTVVAAFLAAVSSTTVTAQNADSPSSGDSAKEKISYVPEFHGVFRGRWELATESGDSRFQVRNARVNISGRVAPFASYFAQVDLCDRGKLKFLDAWAKVNATKDVAIQAGQFKVPFGTDNLRAIGDYFFVNRPFVGKNTSGVRLVGLMGIYEPKNLSVRAGVFNSSANDDHTRWNSYYSAAARVTYTVGDVKFAANFKSVSPDSVRMNLWGGSATWTCGDFTAEGEYIYKHYTHSTHKATHAYNIVADYKIGLKNCFFNALSFQGRFDGMNDNSDGTRLGDGSLKTTDVARRRLTLGSTLSYKYKRLATKVRLNYEKYFYGDAAHVPGDGDKLSAELIVAF
jgi:hypothetical protein